MRIAAVLLVLAACTAPREASTPAATAAAPAAPVELFRGRVRAGEGDPRPIANARVCWVLDERSARTSEAALRSVGEGRTDADGRFALQRPRTGAEGYGALWCERPDGWVLLRAGLQMATQDLLSTQDEEDAPFPRDSFVRMLVTGDGEPLVGARVELSLGDGSAPIGEMRPAAATDARGFVEIHRLEGGEYWADVSAEGFAPVRMATHQFYGEIDPSTHDEHDLPRARTLRCRVAANDGSAPSRAAVHVEYDTGRGGTEFWYVTGADGRLDLAVPAEGAVDLETEAPGYVPARASVSGEDAVVLRLARRRRLGAPPSIVVAEDHGGLVPPERPADVYADAYAGVLREHRIGGAPIGGAKVWAEFDARPARTAAFARRVVTTATTTADGSFSLAAPEFESGTFSLWCERTDGPHLLDAGIEYEDSPRWDLGTFQIPVREDVVRVRVVGEDGDPVAGARVELVRTSDGAPAADRGPVATDAAGLAAFRDLESSRCWVDVVAPGFAPVRAEVSQCHESDATSSEIVRLERSRPLLCRFLAGGGALPDGAAVELSYASMENPGVWLPVCRDGTFAADVPATGEVTVRLVAPGFRATQLDASADAEEYVVDLVRLPK